MAEQRLTKQVVDRLPITGKDYVEWCGKLRGFGCRVRPSGSKSFIAQYRVGGRNTPVRKVTVGAYGKLTVEEARDAAAKILAAAELGQDVAAERTRRRKELTVAQLCDEYLAEGCETKKTSTLATDRGRIERHIKPLLGTKRISDVARADVERFMRDVAAGRTAADVKTKKQGRSIVTGGKGTATRTVRLLGGIFTYAVRRSYITTNPRAGVKLYADGKGERFLSEDELRRLGEALRLAETSGLPWVLNEGRDEKHRPKADEHKREVVSPYVTGAIRLLIFTGARLGEILTLKWSDVDLSRGVLNLSDSKTGAKRILLAAPALQVLADLPRVGKYVVAGADPDKPRSDLKRPWERLTSAADLSGLRIHDLRHSFASVGAAAGMGLSMVGKLLGHASPATTARYSHLADDPVRRASDAIAATLAASLSGGEMGAVAQTKPSKRKATGSP